jgi:hypothetical protein
VVPPAVLPRRGDTEVSSGVGPGATRGSNGLQVAGPGLAETVADGVLV